MDGYNIIIIVFDGKMVVFVEVELFWVYFGERFDFLLEVIVRKGKYLICGVVEDVINLIFVEVVLYYFGVWLDVDINFERF